LPEGKNIGGTTYEVISKCVCSVPSQNDTEKLQKTRVYYCAKWPKIRSV